MTSTRHTLPAAHAAPTFRRRWSTLLPQAAVLLSAMTLAACGGGSDPTRCNGLPCTPSYSVDTDDLAIRVELASDGSRVGGTARLDTGDDLGVPVVLDDEELLLRQGGGEIEFRADDDETVHQTVGTLPAVPGAMYVLRFEREWRRIEGNVVLPPHYEVLAPAAGSVIGSSVAAALAVDTDLSVVDTMRARADLTCTLADNRRVGPRGHDLSVGQAVATTGAVVASSTWRAASPPSKARWAAR